MTLAVGFMNHPGESGVRTNPGEIRSALSARL